METTATYGNTVLDIWLMPAVVALIAILLYFFGNSLLRKYIANIRASIREIGVPFERLMLPLRLLFLLLVCAAILYYVRISAEIKELLHHGLSIVSIVGIAWFMMRFFGVFEQFILRRYKPEDKGDLEARRVVTHVSLIRKIVDVLIIIIAVAGVLMTFDTVRQIGLSILASAGIAGIVLGFAAQRSLQTLIAGIQIAITQPIRIDDVVIVENEWGRIEEITLTYVVVQLWDQRRMIVPITYFIDKPFQNWTRSSSEIIGTVYLYVDYEVSIDKIRKELERITASTALWDGRIARLQVTNTTEKSVELRALVSAANSADVWELRCFVREQLIEFIRKNYPGGLPKERVEMNQAGAAGDSGEVS